MSTTTNTKPPTGAPPTPTPSTGTKTTNEPPPSGGNGPTGNKQPRQ